jgi:hypothetical protein
MSATTGLVYLLVTLAAANLPWLSDRVFFIRQARGEKSAWLRLGEWVVLYVVIAAIGLGLERRATGEVHMQDWEFYVVTLCIFMVFAVPGFIYRYQLRPFLRRGR